MLNGDRKKILIVDDDSAVRESLLLILSRLYLVQAVEGAEQALDLLSKFALYDHSQQLEKEGFPDLILLDVMMPGLDGIAMLEQLRTEFPQISVIMLTAQKSIPTVVRAMKIGAVDYLNKPYDVDELLSLIEETIQKGPTGRSKPSRVQTFEHDRSEIVDLEGDFGPIVGKHPLMTELYSKVEQLAPRETTILITGESGTGKELIAKEIHQRSSRANESFVALNCSAIPESLIESELFGHERGAFTHAHEKRIGHFELADGGTLFLDEIGELSLAVQVKMLRFLQEQEFYRVGCSKPTRVNVRILAATNRSLETAVAQGSFRQDLFYRVNVVSLDMPPLRERREDIPDLIEHFLVKLSPLYGGRSIEMSEEAMKSLLSYSWPGNVRELENAMESMLALSSSDTIEVEALPTRLRPSNSSSDLADEVIEGNIPFEEAERAFEKDLILKALNRTNFVQTKAAELLGISRRILKYKMDKLGIHEPVEQASAP